MTAVRLRDYQAAAVEQLREGVRAGRRKQVLVSPAGSGKTEIACHMLSEALGKRSRALFIVDRVVLVDQSSARLDLYGIQHGVLQAGHWRMRRHEHIQVCSAQTLERRGIPEDVQVVFVDEAHCMRKQTTDFLARTDAIVIGLTATPFAKGMGKVYQGTVNVATVNELIGQGYLVPLKIYAARAIDVTGMKVVAGEWAEKEIEQRGNEIVGDIVAEWVAKTDQHFGGPVKTIVFSATVDHGAELCKQFNAAGYRFEQISYRDGGDEARRELIEEFRREDSQIHGLVSCEVFTKGFDVPDVRCGISARPYRKSLSSHIQQMGRVMRPAPGKEFGLWLDHSGNALRFRADVDDIFANGCAELDDGKRDASARKEPTEKERETHRCSCGCVMAAGQKVCPGCGRERKRLSMVEAVPGQMVELNEGNKANRNTGWDEKAQFYAGLKTIGLNRGYKPGWPAAQYKEKFGVWPDDSRVRHVAPGPVDSQTESWVRSRQIKYAKSRARAA
jgi:DNA repair protein RadD